MTAKPQTKKPKTKPARKKSQSRKAKSASAAIEKEKETAAKKKRFDVEFYRDWCKGCGICAAFCPTTALALEKDGLPYLAYPEKCTLCKLCELRCPDFAITVIAEEEGETR